jgi:hypothetical protein
VQIKTGLIPNGLYKASAVLSSGSAFVQLETGVPNADGDLDNPTPVVGAKMTLSEAGGPDIALQDMGGGTYLLGSSSLPAGKLYTLAIDVDGNGTVEGSGSAYAVGNLAWALPENGKTYNASGFSASWTDSGSSVPGYAPLYIVSLIGTGGGDSYIGSDRSFQPNDGVSGSGPLPAGSYTGTLFAASGGITSGLGSNVSASDNITGIGLQGNFSSLSTPQTVSFTLK